MSYIPPDLTDVPDFHYICPLNIDCKNLKPMEKQELKKHIENHHKYPEAISNLTNHYCARIDTMKILKARNMLDMLK